MKTYIAKLDRDTVTLDLGFKIAVIKNGVEYAESELTAKFPKYFIESVGTSSTPVKEEILLTDDTSNVVVETVEEPVVEEVVETVEEPVAPVDVPVEIAPISKKRK